MSNSKDVQSALTGRPVGTLQGNSLVASRAGDGTPERDTLWTNGHSIAARIVAHLRRASCASAATEPEQDYKAKYFELLYAVGKKHAGESRHDTALRYIRQAEQPSGQAASALSSPSPAPAE